VWQYINEKSEGRGFNLESFDIRYETDPIRVGVDHGGRFPTSIWVAIFRPAAASEESSPWGLSLWTVVVL
jgi:hypothetical protein